MKTLFIFILFFGLVSAAEARRFKTRVDSIDTSFRMGDSHLILLENGRVLFVEYSDQPLLNIFRENLRNKTFLNIEIDEYNNFIGAETIDSNIAMIKSVEVNHRETKRMSYIPSVITLEEASIAFRKMRNDYQQESQCYNRAHVWAWEEYSWNRLNSIKLFLFFTKRYIRNYRYSWWFHVTPMVKTTEGDYVLDRTYTNGPTKINRWTYNFVTSGRRCPVVKIFRDYRNNQESEDCYLIPVSMFFWQPKDIERRDSTGYVKTRFLDSEISYALKEAF